jgi:hypothetical protein
MLGSSHHEPYKLSVHMPMLPLNKDARMSQHSILMMVHATRVDFAAITSSQCGLATIARVLHILIRYRD